MGKAIIDGVVTIIIVGLIVGAVIYFRRKHHQELAQDRGWATRGDLTWRQEAVIIAQNAQAAQIMRSLLTPDLASMADVTLLSEAHRTRIDGWLRRHMEGLRKTEATNNPEGMHE